MSTRPGTPTVLHVRFHPPGGELDPADYEVLLDPLEAITPVVQALPPNAPSSTSPAPCPTSTPTRQAWPR
ncbi:hypothetical protein [Kitasatospora cineracea]|uniref:hypothetical protein n=1 Tax=Kitasatospora cineracea TaxID=88074 RepID=UPI0011CDF92A|nr:hypothetical protein [Kitasatospora cineracea]